MKGFHTILRVLGVGHIGDTQCGFKVSRSNSPPADLEGDMTTAIQPGRCSSSLPASPSSHMDIRCGAPHDRPGTEYSRLGDPGALAGDPWEQVEHCRSFVWDAAGSTYHEVQLLGWSMVGL